MTGWSRWVPMTAVWARRAPAAAGLLAAAALVAAACGGGGAPGAAAPAQGRVPVVATTSILADLVRQVGGDAVAVRPLIPPGADAHTFRTSPKDSVGIGDARLVVTNGAGLDRFLDGVIGSAKKPGTVVVVASQGLAPRASEDADEPEGDPHFWQNPLHVVRYVQQVRDGLSRADPPRAEAYQRNARQYIEELRRLDQEIEAMLRPIPPESRHLVTFHNAFGYFAERYGFKASSLVPHDAGEVTPRALARIIESVRHEQLPAVFAEPQFSRRVVQEVAHQTHARVGTISSDTLTPAAPTYIEMMRANARSLLQNLMGNQS